MPHQEFELYLKLLANLLELEPTQREEIRDEMRDHLEERLAELSELGVPREAAIERALDEFGDAAGLAGSFTQLAREHTQRRRRLVYRTTGSAVVVTLVLLLVVAFWPEGNGNAVAPARAVAQAGPDDPFGILPADGGGTDPAAAATPARRRAPSVGNELLEKVEAALRKPVEVDFFEIPFAEAVEFVSASVEVDILLDEAAIRDIGLELDTPTTLVLRHAKPTARTVLELILAKHGLEGDLGVVVRDGFARITTLDVDAFDVEVYDVRDLVTPTRRAAGPHDHGAEFGGAGVEGAFMDARPIRPRFVQFGGGGFDGGGFGGEEGFEVERSPIEGVAGLLHVIETTVSPSSWERQGGPGTIAAFDGMLVIGNSPEVHRRVQALLDKIRDVRDRKAERRS